MEGDEGRLSPIVELRSIGPRKTLSLEAELPALDFDDHQVGELLTSLAVAARLPVALTLPGFEGILGNVERGGGVLNSRSEEHETRV